MKYSPKRELKRFLDEDVGNGDITSRLLEKKIITAKIISREETVVAGTKFAKEIFSFKKCKVKINKKDGSLAKANQTILIINLRHRVFLLHQKQLINALRQLFLD